MAKNALEGSIKDRIALMWDLDSLGKSQRQIATELKTNQKDVSRHLKVRRVCGKLFLDRLPDDIKVDQLVRLSHARELEKREKLDDTPANDFVNAVATGKTKFTELELLRVANVPRKAWWEACNLFSLAQSSNLQAMHPDLAKILADARNYPSFSELLAAHPPTKSGIKKS